MLNENEEMVLEIILVYVDFGHQIYIIQRIQCIN